MSQPSTTIRPDDKSVFGLWVYLMTDCILFASLFATFAVLRNSTFGGPNGAELFSLPFALTETLVLLTSSFTIGLALLAAHQKNKQIVLIWLGVTILLGIVFLSMEIHEFSQLVYDGYSWQQNAFLSSFFTLVGTHGLHIVTGLLWGVVLVTQLIRNGLDIGVSKGLVMLGIFWHFLDVIWIFIFTIVYLLGAVS